MNQTAVTLTGYKVEELLNQSVHGIFHHSKSDGTPYPATDCPLYAAFRDGLVYHRDDEVFWRKDGTSFPVEYRSVPMWDEQDRLLGAVVTFQDISQRKKAQEEIGRLNRNLEQRVIERTTELQVANTLLSEQLVMHEQAEKALRPVKNNFVRWLRRPPMRLCYQMRKGSSCHGTLQPSFSLAILRTRSSVNRSRRLCQVAIENGIDKACSDFSRPAKHE